MSIASAWARGNLGRMSFFRKDKVRGICGRSPRFARDDKGMVPFRGSETTVGISVRTCQRHLYGLRADDIRPYAIIPYLSTGLRSSPQRDVPAGEVTMQKGGVFEIDKTVGVDVGIGEIKRNIPPAGEETHKLCDVQK